MALFQQKIIQKALSKQALDIPQPQLDILQNWKESIESGLLLSQTEVAVHAPFTDRIMAGILGYQTIGHGESWTVSREYGVASGAVDLALGYFGKDKSQDKVIAPFELKGAKTKNLDAIMSGRHKTPVQQAWDYARDIKGAQWVLLSNYVEFRLYAVSETSLVYESFQLADLTCPLEYTRFVLLLHADNLLSGKTLALLQQSQQADKDITDRLYEDYKTLREYLITCLIENNPGFSPISLINPAQKLLDRLLFVAFAEDKGLIPDNSIKQAFEHNDPYNPRPLYENFKGLFKAIDKGNKQLQIPAYNGGLFANDEALDNLVVTDSVCQSVNELAKYDFDSEVSVTVLGHIFEQSIADLEALSAQISEGKLPTKPKPKSKSVKGKRKTDGVVYTPDHITAFIVEHTLGNYIEASFQQLLSEYGQFKKDGSIQWKKGKQTELRFWYAWQEAIKNIKVVDPACGSGAFLVAAFDALHAEYQGINDKLAELTGQHSVLDLNKAILNNNLYGVDINSESIEISKLSLWLKTAERGKSLTTLDNNLITGNSLGFEKPAPSSDFTWHMAFPEIMADGGFDVVLGNPPYVRQELFSGIKPWLEENYAVYHGVVDLYAYFYELGHKLLKPGGRLGYISSSTFFKTSSGEPLRSYFNEQTRLEKIVDFGDLQVFEGVTTYPAIVVVEKSTPKPDSLIQILVLEDKLPKNLSQHFVQYGGRMPQGQLSTNSWHLEDEKLDRLRQKLTLGHPTLKGVYGSPNYGIKTGLNAAFVIDENTRKKLVDEDPRSAELLKPFLEGRDLKAWHAEPRGLWLIFTRRGIELNNFPAIQRYLEQFRGRLEPKPASWVDIAKDKKWPASKPSDWPSDYMSEWPTDKPADWDDKWTWFGRKSGPYQWYEIQDTVAYYENFEAPKIQYAHFSPTPVFHKNVQGHYSNDKGYIIPTDEYFPLGLLNSRALWLLITGLCPFVRGGYFELRAQYIETLPIPNATEEQKKTIGDLAEQCQSLSEQRYNIQYNFRRRLPDLCSAEQTFKLSKKLNQWWVLDFDNFQKEITKSFKGVIPLAERNEWHDYFDAEQRKSADLSQQLVQLENQLNQEVYALFQLTKEEVALLESNLSI